jgi:hypothetical protein
MRDQGDTLKSLDLLSHPFSEVSERISSPDIRSIASDETESRQLEIFVRSIEYEAFDTNDFQTTI